MVTRGPDTWRNWHEAAAEGKGPDWYRLEATLYSDGYLVGGVSSNLGPYSFINTVPALKDGLVPAIVVRADSFLVIELDMERTDVSTYHGADFFEELAAILSLTLGIRCRSGGMTRYWSKGDRDSFGNPSEFDHVPPYLPSNAQRHSLIPNLRRMVNIQDVVPFFHRLMATDPASAVAAVRAARLYQQAMWVSDAVTG
jgi:hypothetical protein